MVHASGNPIAVHAVAGRKKVDAAAAYQAAALEAAAPIGGMYMLLQYFMPATLVLNVVLHSS